MNSCDINDINKNYNYSAIQRLITFQKIIKEK